MKDNFWKDLALYLIDCELGTAERARCYKSVPKGEKKRHDQICQMISNSYKAQALISKYPTRQEEHVIHRLQQYLGDDRAISSQG